MPLRAWGNQTGTAEVTVNEIVHHQAPIVPGGDPVTVPITVPGQRGELRLEAAEGDRVSLRAAHGLSCSGTR